MTSQCLRSFSINDILGIAHEPSTAKETAAERSNFTQHRNGTNRNVGIYTCDSRAETVTRKVSDDVIATEFEKIIERNVVSVPQEPTASQTDDIRHFYTPQNHQNAPQTQNSGRSRQAHAGAGSVQSDRRAYHRLGYADGGWR